MLIIEMPSFGTSCLSDIGEDFKQLLKSGTSQSEWQCQ